MISIEKSNIGTTLLPKMTTTGWDNINQLVTGSNSQDHTGMEFKILEQFDQKIFSKKNLNRFFQFFQFFSKTIWASNFFCEIRIFFEFTYDIFIQYKIKIGNIKRPGWKKEIRIRFYRTFFGFYLTFSVHFRPNTNSNYPVLPITFRIVGF